MPELPEVEVTRLGIEPVLIDHSIDAVCVRNRRMRWLIPNSFENSLLHKKIIKIDRRGKYLLLLAAKGGLILHLGMSGRIILLKKFIAPQKHDHLDVVFDHGWILRLRDPRRFGAAIWVDENLMEHPLLKKLGKEPLVPGFNAAYLFDRLQKRKQAIKLSLMDAQLVVGVGNIYANEALFLAEISPLRPAFKITFEECQCLTKVIKTVLKKAIEKGGTTLKDFAQSDGKLGYFSNKLQVYGRGGKACMRCKAKLNEIRLGQRTTVYCSSCQR